MTNLVINSFRICKITYPIRRGLEKEPLSNSKFDEDGAFNIVTQAKSEMKHL